MIELQLDGDMKYEAEAFGRTAWRLESSLREFPNIIPVDFWFDYPIHTLARPEELTQAPAKGSVAAKIRGGKTAAAMSVLNASAWHLPPVRSIPTLRSRFPQSHPTWT